MSGGFPVVRLGTVMRQRREFVEISDLETYKRCRVQLHAKGVVLRDQVLGAEIKTKTQQICHAGEFLVAEIDAKVGGFGIVPEDLEGAIVSSHYFLFDVDELVLDRRFLGYYTRTPTFRDQVAAQGSTNYAAIRPSDVLGYEVPLPTLEQQRRIVARIEELAAKIEEAQRLHREAMEDTEKLVRAALDREYTLVASRYGTTKLENVCSRITDGNHVTPAFVDQGVKFIFVGNVSSGHLHFRGCKYVASDYYSDLKSDRRPKRGDILYSAVGATLGVPVLVDRDEDFCFQRHIAIIKPDRSKIVPAYLRFMLQSDTIYRRAWADTTGSAQPTVPLGAIRMFPVPVPPLLEQHRVAARLEDWQTRGDALKELQAEAAAQLNALLPSILDGAFKGEL